MAKIEKDGSRTSEAREKRERSRHTDLKIVFNTFVPKSPLTRRGCLERKTLFDLLRSHDFILFLAGIERGLFLCDEQWWTFSVMLIDL